MIPTSGASSKSDRAMNRSKTKELRVRDVSGKRSFTIYAESIGDLVDALHRRTGYSRDTLGDIVERELRIYTGEIDRYCVLCTVRIDPESQVVDEFMRPDGTRSGHFFCDDHDSTEIEHYSREVFA